MSYTRPDDSTIEISPYNQTGGDTNDAKKVDPQVAQWWTGLSQQDQQKLLAQGYSPLNPPPNYQNWSADGDSPQDMPDRQWWQYLPFFDQMYEDDLAQWKTDYDRWMQLDQRKYDSTAEQMRRMSDAGLNPNLGYTQASQFQSPGAQGHTPKNTESFNRTLKGIANGIMSAMQIKNIGSTVALNNVKAISEASRQGLMNKQGAKIMTEKTIAENMHPVQMQAMHLKNTYQEKLNNLQEWQKKKVQAELVGVIHDNRYKKFVAEKAAEGWNVHGDPSWLRLMWYELVKGPMEDIFGTEGHSFGTTLIEAGKTLGVSGSR